MSDLPEERFEEASGTPASGPAPPPKEPRTPRAVLNTGLLLYIVVNLSYGLPMLLVPSVLWETIAGVEGDFATALITTRWAGGVLVGLAVGAIFVLMRPSGQRTFVTMLAIHTALAGAALLVSVANGEFKDAGVDAWFYWLSAIVVSVESAYLWYARFKARHELAMPKV